MPKNIRESLTARIFLLTLLLLLGAGTHLRTDRLGHPITYVSVVGDRLQVQVSELTDRLAQFVADAGPILDVFIRDGRAGGGIPGEPDGRVWTRAPLCVRHRPCRV